METQQFDLGERLEEFIRTSRDRDGNLKYLQQINEILAFRKRSLVVDFNEIYQFDEKLATEIINNPLSTL
ncbi:MAG: Minichromosome maintenance protein MCM, partial [Metallosphaera sp.]